MPKIPFTSVCFDSQDKKERLANEIRTGLMSVGNWKLRRLRLSQVGDDLEDRTHNVLVRILELADEMDMDFVSLVTSTNVVNQKTDAERSYQRRVRAAISYFSTDPSDERQTEVIRSLLEMAESLVEIGQKVRFSPQERSYYFLRYVEGEESSASLAEALGVPTERLPKIKNKVLQKLRTVPRLIENELYEK